jgi:two-component system sensor histidine kinase MprB
MLSPSLFTVTASVCIAILLALLAGALWRAHRREVAALEARANLLRDEVAASRERLHAWLSGAAHALSQPLTTLHGTLELALLSDATPTEAHPALRDALEQVQSVVSMTRLLRELADAEMSRQSAQATSLSSLFEELREDLEKLAQARGRRLLLHCDVSSPVLAISPDLRRAIHYLLECALERSPAGSLVQITTIQETNAACIVIRDQGPVIPVQDLPHWFEPFYSGRGGACSKIDALRLAVVERTCASCRGSASAVNDENGGARFILRLPLS